MALTAILFIRHYRLSRYKVVAPVIPCEEMRDGDLAFRIGRGFYSEMLQMLKKPSPDTLYYSHIGLVVNTMPGQGNGWRIIHAVPEEPDFKNDFDRVKISTPEEFFSPDMASHGELVHTGVEFPRHLVDEALGYVRDSIRFDKNFDLEDSTSLYCTELIHRLYCKLGTDLTEGRRSDEFSTIFKHPIIQPVDIWLYKGKDRYFIF